MSLAARSLMEPVPDAPRTLRLVPEPRPVPTRDKGPRAVVVPLFAPTTRDVAAPLRLTRRGVAVVVLVLAALSAAILAIAARSAPAVDTTRTPARVMVRPGDTLWAVAIRVAPQTDPRQEVDALQHLNHLTDVDLQPGEELRIR